MLWIEKIFQYDTHMHLFTRLRNSESNRNCSKYSKVRKCFRDPKEIYATSYLTLNEISKISFFIRHKKFFRFFSMYTNRA